MELDVQIDMEEFKKDIERERRTLLKNTELFAKLVAEAIVNHARSTENGRHPGNWKDVTSALANSIKARIERDGFSVKIIAEATMEYAAALDAKTGYDVLGGSEQLARKFIKKHKHILFD